MATRCKIEAVQQRTSLEVHISQSCGPKVHSRLIYTDRKYIWITGITSFFVYWYCTVFSFFYQFRFHSDLPTSKPFSYTVKEIYGCPHNTELRPKVHLQLLCTDRKYKYNYGQGRRKGGAEGTNAPSIFGKLHPISQILREVEKFAPIAVVWNHHAPSILDPCAVPVYKFYIQQNSFR